MSKPQVAVVILNFNGRHFLERFLPGIVMHSSPHLVCVADNASTDDSRAYVEANFPQVRWIANAANYGYARGYNEALSQVDASSYILVNSDVEVTPGWIDGLLAAAGADPLIAACQPKILDHAKQHLFEYAGAAGGYIDRLGYPFCMGRVFNHLEQDRGQYDAAREIFWASGACLFVRAEAFWKVGGFDGDYFAHMEEIDLCWRLRNLGYRVVSAPASSVYHIGGGTLNKYSTAKTFLNFRNNLTTLAKNHPPRGRFRKIIVRLVLDGVAGVKFLFDAQPGHCWAVVRAHWAFYRWLSSIRAKRKAMEGKPGFAYHLSCVYRGNIVWEHFVRGRKTFSGLLKGFYR